MTVGEPRPIQRKLIARPSGSFTCMPGPGPVGSGAVALNSDVEASSTAAASARPSNRRMPLSVTCSWDELAAGAEYALPHQRARVFGRSPAHDLDPLVRLQILVVGEEVLDL